MKKLELTWIRFNRYAYVALVYVFFMGLARLWGYWSLFDINIFEYLEFSDIFRITAYSLLGSLFILAISGALGLYLTRGVIRESGGVSTPRARATFMFGERIFLLTSISMLILAPDFWLMPFFGIAIVFIFRFLDIVDPGFIIPEVQAKIRYLIVALVPVFFAWESGRAEAMAVISGQQYTYITSDTIDAIDFKNPANAANRFKYLGRANDYIFLLDPDNRTTIVVSFLSTKGLHLSRYSRNRGMFVDLKEFLKDGICRLHFLESTPYCSSRN